MDYILLSEIITGTDTKYDLYIVAENKRCMVDKNVLYNAVKYKTNFKLTSHGKIIHKYAGALKHTKIVDGEIIESHDTIIGISENIMTILKANSDETYTITKEQYTERFVKVFNNEHIIWSRSPRLNTKAYTDKDVSEWFISETDNEPSSVVDTQEIKEETKIENENIPVVEQVNQNNKNKFSSAEELEQELNKVSTEEENKKAIEQIRTSVTIQEDLSEKIDYDSVIFNMYPLDKITIPLDKFKDMRYVLLRVLDSNMSSTITTGLYKIYKDATRINCTIAIIVVNEETGLVVVQCLGQTDDARKAVKDDLEKVCQTYLKWLKENKFIKL